MGKPSRFAQQDFLLDSLSVATSSAHLEDLAYLDEQQRHIPSRTSLRMPRQSSGSRSQQDHRGEQTHTLKRSQVRSVILTTSVTILRPSPLSLQFASFPLSTWSPSTLRSPVSHLIGCSAAGSGSFRKWMPVSAGMTHQPVRVWSSSATWASAKRPSSPVWWRSVVTETECGQLLPEVRPFPSVSRDRQSRKERKTAQYYTGQVIYRMLVVKNYSGLKRGKFLSVFISLNICFQYLDL